MSDTKSHAQQVCDLIDKIDGTPFGKMADLLDRMGTAAELARQEHVRMDGLLKASWDKINEDIS